MFYRIVLCIIIVFLLPQKVNAIFDPLSVPNNIYGIHIADTNDLSNVAPLINSSGGDWGYVTVVLPDTDKNTDKWNLIFDSMRRLHIIPLVRLATHVENAAWVKPKTEDITDTVRFLNSLNWPIENRYIILFNEPNHAKEWGNSLNPEEYATIASLFARELKASSDDYFILPAALDVSASNTSETMDSTQYLKRITETSPEFLQIIDGWNSHSYPNPAFSGPPNAFGRGTVRSYQWELALLKSLGFDRSLPIFITETGWEHREGKENNQSLLPSETVAIYIKEASQGVWKDPNIVAITPFVFSYQDIPFDHFSWKMLGSEEYYIHAKTYQEISKINGRPKQYQSYQIDKNVLPLVFVAGSTYELTTSIKNNGQNILDSRDGYRVEITDTQQNKIFIQEHSVPYLEPGQQGNLSLSISTPLNATSMHVVISIGRDSDFLTLNEKYIRIVPPPSLTAFASVGFNKNVSARSAKILVYDDSQKLIHEYESVSMNDGTMVVSGLTNIIPGREYRIVVVIPGYLPRQVKIILTKGDTSITFPMLLPFDIDEDGALTVNDFVRVLRFKPIDIWRRLF